MPSFKKLPLIATETAETADTATEPKTIPPAVFKNGREVKIHHWAYSRWDSNSHSSVLWANTKAILPRSAEREKKITRDFDLECQVDSLFRNACVRFFCVFFNHTLSLLMFSQTAMICIISDINVPFHYTIENCK